MWPASRRAFDELVSSHVAALTTHARVPAASPHHCLHTSSLILRPGFHGPSEAGNHHHVEEVHQAEHEQADAHTRTDLRDQADGIDLPAVQAVADEAQVDQVEPDHQQAVGRRGQFLVLAETADQEDLAVTR